MFYFTNASLDRLLKRSRSRSREEQESKRRRRSSSGERHSDGRRSDGRRSDGRQSDERPSDERPSERSSGKVCDPKPKEAKVEERSKTYDLFKCMFDFEENLKSLVKYTEKEEGNRKFVRVKINDYLSQFARLMNQFQTDGDKALGRLEPDQFLNSVFANLLFRLQLH